MPDISTLTDEEVVRYFQDGDDPVVQDIARRLGRLADYVAEMEKERDRLEDQIGWLTDAVEEARDMFAFYAKHHRDNGAAEKADRNQKLADKMDDALL